ncbi:hypothetical protein AUJ17_03860 [Candidatus Micrarchaeota archaeon CG1_02_47_40]|nr:MAG: hypothetical protein AUJ17_03860 [Candidatus Micrarchaeota archaeon CG1_02_47_40]
MDGKEDAKIRERGSRMEESEKKGAWLRERSNRIEELEKRMDFLLEQLVKAQGGYTSGRLKQGGVEDERKLLELEGRIAGFGEEIRELREKIDEAEKGAVGRRIVRYV